MTAIKVVLLSTCVCFAFVHSSGATCGGTFTATSGTITSPGFPNNYTNNASCIYIITAPTNQRITLNFTHFDLEAPSPTSGGCFDYVEVQDGNSTFSPRLGLFCNNTLPAMRRSFGHQMRIKFITDDSVVKTGFNATYTTGTYDNSFFLITSSSGSIFRMDAETRTNYNLKMILRNPIAVDFDPVEQTIYWSEVGTTNNIIASASPTGSNIRFVKNAGIGAVIDGLAVDPFSRLLFYTDAGNDVIAMMTLSTFSHKTIINSSLDRPRAIVLHVADGVMFWTDWGGPAKIERSNYDGSDRRTLVSFYLLYVNALALDVANNRLYWADAGTDHVESVNLDGGDRSSPPIFQAQSTHHFFGMALLRNALYITDWGPAGAQSTFSRIIRQPLGADRNNRTVYGSIGQRMNDIHAYDQDWATSGPNGCGNNNGACSSFCVPLPGNRSKCLCPDGESLLADNTTCVDASLITTQTTTTPTTPTTTTTTPTTTTTTPTTTTTTPTTTTTTPTTTTTTPTTTTTTPTTTTTTPTTTTTTPTTTTTTPTTTTTTPTTTTTTPTTTTTTPTTTTKTPTTTTTTPPPTPDLTNISVVVKTSHDLPFTADGSRDLTLTCDLAQTVLRYAWNVRCSRKSGNWCVFRPTAMDDGRKVTCTVTLADGRVTAGSLVLNLQYPPQTPPYITGYESGSPLQVGDSLTMTCAVNGGKPLASAVIFSCPGHSDNARDIQGRTEVHSLIVIKSLRKEDNGTRCECSGQWLGSSVFYPPRHSVTLLVLGATPGGGTEKTDPIPIIGGAVGGFVVVVIIIVIIVVIVKRNKPIYEKPPQRRKRRAKVQEEHPYSDLAVINIASDTENTQDCRNSTYAEIGDLPIPDHDPADVPSLPDRPTTLAPPVPCSVRQTPSPAVDYLTPTARQTPSPADDYMTPTARQTPSPADDYMTPTARPAHSYHVSTVNPPPTFPKPSAHLGQSYPLPTLPKPDYATFINPN